jgi:hypothetical protein
MLNRESTQAIPASQPIGIQGGMPGASQVVGRIRNRRESIVTLHREPPVASLEPTSYLRNRVSRHNYYKLLFEGNPLPMFEAQA